MVDETPTAAHGLQGWMKRYLPGIVGGAGGITVSYLVQNAGAVALVVVWLLIVLGVVAAYAAIWRGALRSRKAPPDLLAGEVEVLNTRLTADLGHRIAYASKWFSKGEVLDVVITGGPIFDAFEFYVLDSQDMGRLSSEKALAKMMPLVRAHVVNRHKEIVTIPWADDWYFMIEISKGSFLTADLSVYSFPRAE